MADHINHIKGIEPNQTRKAKVLLLRPSPNINPDTLGGRATQAPSTSAMDAPAPRSPITSPHL